MHRHRCPIAPRRAVAAGDFLSPPASRVRSLAFGLSSASISLPAATASDTGSPGRGPNLATPARLAKLRSARMVVVPEPHADRPGSTAPRIARRWSGVRGTGHEHNQPSNAAHFAAPELPAFSRHSREPLPPLGLASNRWGGCTGLSIRWLRVRLPSASIRFAAENPLFCRRFGG